jgi:hypothetical protein
VRGELSSRQGQRAVGADVEQADEVPATITDKLGTDFQWTTKRASHVLKHRKSSFIYLQPMFQAIGND